ncbi:ATP-binding protein [candidate division KSB1 bacterium]
MKYLDKIFRKLLLNRIVSQFIFSHVLLVTLSIALVGIFLLTATNNFMRESVNNRNLEKATTTAREIYSFVQNTFTILTFATGFQDINAMESFRQELALNRLKIDYQFYRDIYVIDTTGTVVASTELGTPETLFADTTIFPLIAEKKQNISAVHIDVEENEPMVIVTTPIYQLDRYVGVLHVEVSIKFIWDLVDSLSQNITGGMVYVLSDNGTVIAHPDRKYVFGRENFGKFDFVQRLISGEIGTGRYIDPANDYEEFICAYTPVEQLRWGIVVAQPESIAFEVFHDTVTNLIFIIIGSIILASLLGVVITRNLVSPLNSLVNSVKRVYEGSLPSRVSVPQTEELATLAIEFNRMTENLDNVQKKLQKAEQLATMSKFASVVAHEIRNPFNSIVINMQILKRAMANQESSERLENFMDIIDTEIRRIDGLIQNYLSLAKPPEFKRATTDLNVLLDELILLQHAKASKQSIEVNRTSDQEPLIVSVDANQMKQAFLNIILNAFQAMPEGGKLGIDIAVRHNDKNYENTVRILFSDTGTGIFPEDLPEVFEFFYSTKKSGTGLGLAVTKQIIQGHSGSISVESKTGEGTTVKVYLPL